MNVFDLQAIVRLDSSQFESGLKNVVSGAKNIGSSVGSALKAGVSTIANITTGAIAGVAAGLSGLGAYAAKVGKSFESSMSQVAAVMGITKDTVKDGVNQYELLENAAAEAGKNTVFSASEAADALNYLALAGYDASKAAEALPSVLNLAQAGGLDLAYASDLATDAMASLGIEATKKNLDEFGDKMAKAASKANLSVAQLGEAILTVGGTAKSLRGGTTELNAVLGVLANRGIKGSEAGTQLRNIIMSLSSPTDTAAERLEELGVAAYDDTGKMRPLNEVFEDFNNALANCTDQEKKQALGDIFNKVDLKSAEALLAGVGEEFDNLAYEIENSSGAMADMATTMTDNLEGAMKSLGSKAEAFGIQIYDSIQGPLKDLVNVAGDSINQLSDAFDNGGFSGLTQGIEDVVSNIATKFSDNIPSFAETAINGVKDIILAVTDGITNNSSTIVDSIIKIGNSVIGNWSSVFSDIGSLIGNLIEAVANGVSDSAPSIMGTFINLIDTISITMMSLINKIATNLPSFVENLTPIIANLGTAIGKVITSIVTNISDNSGGISDAFVGLVDTLSNTVLTLITTLISNIPKLITTLIPILLEALVTLATNIGNELPNIITTITDGIKQIISPDFLSKFIEAGPKIIMALLDGILTSIPILIDTIPVLYDNLLQTITQAYPKLFEAGEEILETVINGLMTILPKMLETVPKILESLLTAIQDNMPVIINGVISLLDTFTTLWPELIGVLVESLGTVLPQVIDLAVQIMEALIDGLWSNMPMIASSLWGIIKKVFSKSKDLQPVAFEAVKKILSSVVDAIIEYFPFVWETFKEVVSQIWDFISPYLSKLWDSIVEWFSDWEAIGELLYDVNEKIEEWFGKVIGIVVDWLGGLWEKVSEKVGGFFEGVGEWLYDAREKFRSWLGKVIGNVVEWGVDMYNKSREAAEDFLNNIIEFIKQLPEKIWDFLTKAADKVLEWREKLKEKAEDAISGLIDKVVEKVKELPEKMKNAGKDIVEGLWEGITGAKDWLEEKIGGFADNFVGGFKKLFGIHSPSTVMRDKVGKFLAQGISVGFTDEMKGLERSNVSVAMNSFGRLSGAVSEFNSRINRGNISNPTAAGNVIESINIYMEGMQIASDYDVDRMTDRAVERLRERLKMVDVYDKRGLGGTGW